MGRKLEALKEALDVSDSGILSIVGTIFILTAIFVGLWITLVGNLMGIQYNIPVGIAYLLGFSALGVWFWLASENVTNYYGDRKH